MGKGDRKTAKGKRAIASYGNSRTHVAAKTTGTTSAPVVKKTPSRGISKAPAKKAVARKAAVKE